MSDRGVTENHRDLQVLVGRRVESADLLHQEGDVYEITLRLDDRSVMHIEAWGNSALRHPLGLPESTRYGINIGVSSREEVEEVEREFDALEQADDKQGGDPPH